MEALHSQILDLLQRLDKTALYEGALIFYGMYPLYMSLIWMGLAVFFRFLFRLLSILFRIPKVGHQNEALRFLFEYIFYGRECGANPNVVLDSSIF